MVNVQCSGNLIKTSRQDWQSFLVSKSISVPEGGHTLILWGEGIEALCLGSSQTPHYLYLLLQVNYGVVLSSVAYSGKLLNPSGL